MISKIISNTTYKLYSRETVGVVIQDYIVYHNIDSRALAMVDVNHESLTKVSSIKATKVKIN